MTTFKCHDAGCMSGGSFEADPEEEVFFRKHDLIWPPRACPACRAWKKSQSPSQINCELCGRARLIGTNEKIMHHRRIGPWTPPTVCNPCERDPGRAARKLDEAEGRAAARGKTADVFYGRLEQTLRENRLTVGLTSITPLKLSDDLSTYHSRRPGRDTLYEHVFESHGDELIAALGLEVRSDENTLFDPTQIDREILGHLCAIVASPDNTRVAEFRQIAGLRHVNGSQRYYPDAIVKLDKETNVVVLLKIPSAGQAPELMTAYAPPEAQIANKLAGEPPLWVAA